MSSPKSICWVFGVNLFVSEHGDSSGADAGVSALLPES